MDEAGRRQYTYHADWSKRQDKGKFARALQLAETLPRARARVTQSLRRSEADDFFLASAGWARSRKRFIVFSCSSVGQARLSFQ